MGEDTEIIPSAGCKGLYLGIGFYLGQEALQRGRVLEIEFLLCLFRDQSLLPLSRLQLQNHKNILCLRTRISTNVLLQSMKCFVVS